MEYKLVVKDYNSLYTIYLTKLYKVLVRAVSVTATQSIEEPSTVIQRAHACAIGLSIDSDIKIRSRRRWWKGHVYIYMPRLKRAP